jgi:hypothetical protein
LVPAHAEGGSNVALEQRVEQLLAEGAFARESRRLNRL